MNSQLSVDNCWLVWLTAVMDDFDRSFLKTMALLMVLMWVLVILPTLAVVWLVEGRLI